MKIGEATGTAELRTYQGDDSWPLSTCRIGVELEYEGNPNVYDRDWNGLTPYWDRVRDGSLRNRGLEYVSKPLFGLDLVKALDKLGTALRSSGGAEVTYRCGLHIHMDVSDMVFEELKSLLVIYSLFERSLFRHVGEDREDNIYCIPYWKNPLPIENFCMLDFRSLDPSILKQQFDDHMLTSEEQINNSILGRITETSSKYSALNLRPIPRQGSIEFRQGLSTLNMEEVKEWIRLLMCLKRGATALPAEEVLRLMYGEGPQVLAETMFGQEIKLFKPEVLPNLDADVEQGLFLAKEISYGLPATEEFRNLLRYDEINSHPGFQALVKSRESYYKSRKPDWYNNHKDMVQREYRELGSDQGQVTLQPNFRQPDGIRPGGGEDFHVGIPIHPEGDE